MKKIKTLLAACLMLSAVGSAFCAGKKSPKDLFNKVKENVSKKSESKSKEDSKSVKIFEIDEKQYLGALKSLQGSKNFELIVKVKKSGIKFYDKIALFDLIVFDRDYKNCSSRAYTFSSCENFYDGELIKERITSDASEYLIFHLVQGNEKYSPEMVLSCKKIEGLASMEDVKALQQKKNAAAQETMINHPEDFFKINIYGGGDDIGVQILGIKKEILSLGSIDTLVIPEYIEGEKVTEVFIQDAIELQNIVFSKNENVVYHFSGIKIDKLVIPARFKLKDDNSGFGSCSIGLVEFEDGTVEIPSKAFYGCDIKDIKIPDSVTKIGASAFRECTGLEKVVLPDGITRIEKFAFERTGINEINLPAKIEFVGSDAFCCTRENRRTGEKKGLTNIIIPDSINKFEYNANTAFDFSLLPQKTKIMLLKLQKRD